MADRPAEVSPDNHGFQNLPASVLPAHYGGSCSPLRFDSFKTFEALVAFRQQGKLPDECSPGVSSPGVREGRVWGFTQCLSQCLATPDILRRADLVWEADCVFQLWAERPTQKGLPLPASFRSRPTAVVQFVVKWPEPSSYRASSSRPEVNGIRAAEVMLSDFHSLGMPRKTRCLASEITGVIFK